MHSYKKKRVYAISSMSQFVRASHQYHKVTGSNPVEVRIFIYLFIFFFFQASLRNCISCVHNCKDHPSLDLISAVYILFISYSSFKSQLTSSRVERFTIRIARLLAPANPYGAYMCRRLIDYVRVEFNYLYLIYTWLPSIRKPVEAKKPIFSTLSRCFIDLSLKTVSVW